MQVILRDLTKEDEPFVYATWSKNQWYGKPRSEFTKETKKEWFSKKFKEIKKSLEGDQIAVACLKEDPYMILGYIVIKDNKLEWCYTKQDYRSSKIEELLLSQVKRENQDGRNKARDQAECDIKKTD